MGLTSKPNTLNWMIDLSKSKFGTQLDKRNLGLSLNHTTRIRKDALLYLIFLLKHLSTLLKLTLSSTKMIPNVRIRTISFLLATNATRN